MASFAIELIFGRGSTPVVIRAFKLYVAIRVLRFVYRWIKGFVDPKRLICETAMPYVKMLPMVQHQLKKTQIELRASLSKEMSKESESDAMRSTTRLPKEGVCTNALLELMKMRAEIDTKHWVKGKITGAVYHGGEEHMEFCGKVMGMFAYTNPLHPGLHPATRKMDAEVVRMVLNMYNGDEKTSCGVFTTGGTESILCAIKSYRDRGRAINGIYDPNIVICQTAHAAFDKACQYFAIKIRKARTDPLTQRVDVSHLESLIDGNTVCIVGSAVQFPHGSMDPIEELSTIALRKNIGLHVDCCLGGFIVPFMEKAGFKPFQKFDFRVPGVTTISCDPHKYGFSPKGASVLMFRDQSLRHHMYSFCVDWTGGIYATPTLTGSRAGSVVAACWASMMHYGENGYVESTRKIVAATRRIAKGITDEFDQIDVVGVPDASVVAFGASKSSKVNIYSVADVMKDRFGWELATLQNPPSVHLALTLPTAKNADLFLSNLKHSVGTVLQDPKKYSKGTAGIYGMAASLPTQLIEESVKVYLDVCSGTISTSSSSK